MRRRRNRWFTIVATDMFSGAFAAIVLLDTITPKQMGIRPSSQEIRITYSVAGGAKCPDKADGDAVVFSFLDGGNPQSTIDKGFQSNLVGQNCVISGFLNVYYPDFKEPCVLSVIGGPPPAAIRVEVTGSSYNDTPKSCI